MSKQRTGGMFFGIFEELIRYGVGESLPGVVPWHPELYHIMAQGQMDEINPVLAVAREVGSPVLELGCGTGRLLLPLAREGYEVTGVERNPKMIEILQEKLATAPKKVSERISIIPQDMREFSTEKRFKLAFFSANTFLYLITAENQKKVLQRVREHLEPGGLVIIDTYFSRNGWGSEEPYCRTGHDRQTGETVLYVVQALHDPVCGVSHMNAVSVLFQPGKMPRVLVQGWKEASLTPKETRLLLESCGFEIVRIEGDHNGSPLTPESVEVITVGRKVE